MIKRHKEKLLIAWIIVFTVYGFYSFNALQNNAQDLRTGVVAGCVKVLTVQRTIIQNNLDSKPTGVKLTRLNKDYILADPSRCKNLIHNIKGLK